MSDNLIGDVSQRKNNRVDHFILDRIDLMAVITSCAER